MGIFNFVSKTIEFNKSRNQIVLDIQHKVNNFYFEQKINTQIKISIPPIDPYNIVIDSNDNEISQFLHQVLIIKPMNQINILEEKFIKEFIVNEILEKASARKLRFNKLSHIAFEYNDQYMPFKIVEYI